jgi:hypothetical protein
MKFRVSRHSVANLPARSLIAPGYSGAWAQNLSGSQNVSNFYAARL